MKRTVEFRTNYCQTHKLMEHVEINRDTLNLDSSVNNLYCNLSSVNCMEYYCRIVEAQKMYVTHWWNLKSGT